MEHGLYTSAQCHKPSELDRMTFNNNSAYSEDANLSNPLHNKPSTNTCTALAEATHTGNDPATYTIYQASSTRLDHTSACTNYIDFGFPSQLYSTNDIRPLPDTAENKQSNMPNSVSTSSDY